MSDTKIKWDDAKVEAALTKMHEQGPGIRKQAEQNGAVKTTWESMEKHAASRASDAAKTVSKKSPSKAPQVKSFLDMVCKALTGSTMLKGVKDQRTGVQNLQKTEERRVDMGKLWTKLTEWETSDDTSTSKIRDTLHELKGYKLETGDEEKKLASGVDGMIELMDDVDCTTLAHKAATEVADAMSCVVDMAEFLPAKPKTEEGKNIVDVDVPKAKVHRWGASLLDSNFQLDAVELAGASKAQVEKQLNTMRKQMEKPKIENLPAPKVKALFKPWEKVEESARKALKKRCGDFVESKKSALTELVDSGEGFVKALDNWRKLRATNKSLVETLSAGKPLKDQMKLLPSGSANFDALATSMQKAQTAYTKEQSKWNELGEAVDNEMLARRVKASKILVALHYDNEMLSVMSNKSSAGAATTLLQCKRIVSEVDGKKVKGEIDISDLNERLWKETTATSGTKKK